MRKKLWFLTTALALAMMPFSSCSKDEPTPMDVAKGNVANTEWLGYEKFFGSATLQFNGDGTFVLDMDSSYLPYARGTYSQNGTSIKFFLDQSWAFPYDFSEGTISKSGGSMEIPMYYRYGGEYACTVKFTLDVLKD